MVFGHQLEADDGWKKVIEEEIEKILSEEEEESNGGMDEHFWDTDFDEDKGFAENEDDDDEWIDDEDWEINDRVRD